MVGAWSVGEGERAWRNNDKDRVDENQRDGNSERGGHQVDSSLCASVTIGCCLLKKVRHSSGMCVASMSHDIDSWRWSCADRSFVVHALLYIVPLPVACGQVKTEE